MFDYWHNNPPKPFNPEFRKGFGEAVSKEYTAWSYANEGHSREEGMAKHKEICDRLRPKFPSVKELQQ